MRNTMTVVSLLLVAAVPASVARAQEIRVEQTFTGEMIQRGEPGREMKTGTARIQGRVYALESGQPIRRAQVRIAGQDIMPKAALTDAEGRYEFRDLPAGRFTLHASKSGYVSVQFGQSRPYESGRPIELADAQAIENGDIAMPGGSVIAGRIVDEFGDPMPDVQVTALRQSWANGRRRLVPGGGRIATTNDLGQFRIYGLPPGDYYVSATLRGGAMEFMAMEMMAGARGGAMPAPSASTPSSGYAPTYFPGTSSAAEAQKITLITGQENHGADFSLLPVRLARVSGIVVGSDGQPVSGAMVNVTPRDRAGTIFFSGMTSARTNQDGAFTINGVAPGDYMLQANTIHITTSREEGGRMIAVRTFGPGGGGADRETGFLPLVVAGEDVSNLVLVTGKGGRASGRVVFEGGAQPQNMGGLRILASSLDADGPMGSGGGAAVVKPDGAFELTGLAGPQLVRPAITPPGWRLKEVRLNGQDITDTGADFRPGEAVSGLEVVLTNRTTSVTGGVTAGDGSPLKDYTVVIFADDEDLWRVPRSRWLTGVRPDQEGRFKVDNLPPGSYHAVAVEYIPEGEWGDPDLLARLKEKGERFTLDEGGSEMLNLTIVSAY